MNSRRNAGEIQEGIPDKKTPGGFHGRIPGEIRERIPGGIFEKFLEYILREGIPGRVLEGILVGFMK